MKTAAIILAAGRGSRMKSLTEDRPKCLVELAGRPLLAWQLDALADIDKIMVVVGYRAQDICGDFETVENRDWQATNMVHSLLCAKDFAKKFFEAGGERLIVSYSDIVYHPDHIKKLLQTTANIAIAYDTEWEQLWRLRFSDILSDAETFKQINGRLVEIGERPGSLEQIHGQYMGLLSFNQAGWRQLAETATNLGQKLAKIDMTSFLRLLLANAIPVEAVPVRGKWCESDSGEDLALYESAIRNDNWSHDWRP